MFAIYYTPIPLPFRSLPPVLLTLLTLFLFFFFNDPATTEIYTLSLHDALPIYGLGDETVLDRLGLDPLGVQPAAVDRKSTRLNSSHQIISYAVFCLKKKKDGRWCSWVSWVPLGRRKPAPSPHAPSRAPTRSTLH